MAERWVSEDGSFGYEPDRKKNPAYSEWFKKRYKDPEVEKQLKKEGLSYNRKGNNYEYFKRKTELSKKNAGPKPTPWLDQIERVGPYHPDQRDEEYDDYGNPNAPTDWAAWQGPSSGFAGGSTRQNNEGVISGRPDSYFRDLPEEERGYTDVFPFTRLSLTAPRNRAVDNFAGNTNRFFDMLFEHRNRVGRQSDTLLTTLFEQLNKEERNS